MPFPSNLPRLTMGEAQPTHSPKRRPSTSHASGIRRTGVARGTTCRPGRKPKRNPGTAASRLSWQVGASLVILLAVGVLHLIQLPATDQALEGLGYVLSSSSMPGDFGGLQFIQNWNDKAVSVFSAGNQSPAFTCPGTAYTLSSQEALAAQQVLDVTCDAGTVGCVADGQVFFVGQSGDKGPYVIVRHSQGYESVYWPVTAAVKTGQSLLAGQKLADVEPGTVIHCQVLQDDAPVAPDALFGAQPSGTASTAQPSPAPSPATEDE